MEKTAVVEHEVIKEIKQRRSGRAYLEKSVEPEKIDSILEAARWAPSSSNEQPWRYILGIKENNAEVYNKILDALADSNKIWVQKAPVILVSLAKKTTIRNGSVNRFHMHDTGAANVSLGIQAAAIGLMAHPMGGYDYEKMKASFNIPDDYEIAAVIAVGYPGGPEELPENLQARETAPRERYTQSEIVMTKGFEKL